MNTIHFKRYVSPIACLDGTSTALSGSSALVAERSESRSKRHTYLVSCTNAAQLDNAAELEHEHYFPRFVSPPHYRSE